MQRRTQMNLQLQQQWTHDGEEPKRTRVSRPKTRVQRKSTKRSNLPAKN